ncbi:MAG: AIPR family protein, partial [Geobacter sp.]
MSGEKTSRMSEDNIPYEVLLTPNKIEYQNIDFISSHSFIDGYSFYHLYVSVSEVKRLSLPTDANPREPTRVDVVNKMISAIKDDPDKFHHWNNGITIICNGVTHNDSEKTLEIDFTEGDGICNGGHTYFSIATFEGPINDLCKVHLELVCLPQSLEGNDRKHAVNQIASKRNRNRQLHPTTQADYLGLYKPFQNKLKNYRKFISWHEGDSEAHDDSIKSDHFIRLMASLDPFWFQHPQISAAKTKANHKAATGGIASIHSKWMAGAENNNPEASLFHMSELAREIIELRDDIAYSIKDDDFSGV